MTNNSKNKSEIYGYYGGVTGENHYVPPESPDFIPQPPKPRFQELLTEVENATNFLKQHKENIVLRSKVESQPNNVDTFVLKTVGDPNETIKYTTNQDEAELGDLAGKGIVNREKPEQDEVLDGGMF